MSIETKVHDLKTTSFRYSQEKIDRILNENLDEGKGMSYLIGKLLDDALEPAPYKGDNNPLDLAPEVKQHILQLAKERGKSFEDLILESVIEVEEIKQMEEKIAAINTRSIHLEQKFDELEESLEEARIVHQKSNYTLDRADEKFERFQRSAESAANIIEKAISDTEKAIKSTTKNWNLLADKFSETTTHFQTLADFCSVIPDYKKKIDEELEEYKRSLRAESDGYREKLDRFVVKHFLFASLFFGSLFGIFLIVNTYLPQLLK